MTHLRRAILAAALFCGAATTAGLAAGQEISFKDKRINVIIGSSPGGGTDATTRHLGRFLERHLPGNPQMVYRNIPAGQGVKATNYFANEARRDGTAWMGGASNYISASTLRKSVVEYDPTRFAFVGGINRGGSLLIMRKSKLADLADKSKPPMVAGTTDGSPSWTMMVLWGTDVLGWNVKFVVGYPGTSALLLAARRGEIDSFGTSNLAMLKTLQTSGEFVGMAQDGQLEGGKFVPRSDLGDVPTISALVEGRLSGLAKEAFDFWNQANQVDKWYALPPKTPAPVVTAYRTAFALAARDPDFARTGKALFGEDFTVQSGEDMTAVVHDTSRPRPELLDYRRRLKARYGLPEDRLSAAEMARLAKERGGILNVTSPLTKVERAGRVLHFKADGKNHKARVSGSRTKVTIAGKPVKRARLEAGMTCDIAYGGDGSEAQSVACR